MSNYEAVNGSKLIFFFILLTFGRDTTSYRGTLVENVKKVEIQPTLLYNIRGLTCQIWLQGGGQPLTGGSRGQQGEESHQDAGAADH
jgi:hypothetical protein